MFNDSEIKLFIGFLIFFSDWQIPVFCRTVIKWRKRLHYLKRRVPKSKGSGVKTT